MNYLAEFYTVQIKEISNIYHCTKFCLKAVSKTLVMNDYLRAMQCCVNIFGCTFKFAIRPSLIYCLFPVP